MARDAIGKKKRRMLRREVGFGCPVEGCRVPFLEYHHFDPPFNEGKMHNEDGMIALCPIHHRQADQGAWSIEDLHQMKKAKKREKPKGRLGWSIDEGVVICGNNYLFSPSLTLRMKGKELFKLEQDQKGKISVNTLLWNNQKEIVAEVKNNDMLLNHMIADDIDCMASGKEIYFRAPDNSNFIKIKFERLPIEECLSQAKNCLNQNVNKSVSSKIIERELNGMINVIKFHTTINEDDFSFRAGDSKITFDFRKVGLGKEDYYGNEHGVNGALNFITENGQELIYLGK
ncbi:hypothetical protein GLW00_06935 [Halobacillus litoralis]|uniref:HNH nuclease domain-containing protein n=1 Tax=Halobacillus litoralis TaxID=45668 RepID=A0A845FA75_9BACI|nr:HNH endonuclease [Halobacillus litoralis]MYL70576.1 hypothetical protein [Halobacillus litoralis]